MSDYVYNYGDGDEVLVVSEDDSISFDSDTAIHIRGIQQVNEETKIVFDDYSSLNVFGRVGSVIVNGETVIHNEPIATPSTSKELSVTDYESEIFATPSDTIDLNSMGITSDRIRGIQQVYGYRTLVVYDNYNSLNIYGKPGAVVLDGNTIISNDWSSYEDWGDSSSESAMYLTNPYSNEVLYLSNSSTIDLSSVTWDDILGYKIEDDRSMFAFSDFSGFQVLGNPDTLLVGDETYAINYNNHSITQVSTSSTTETSTEA